MSLLSREALCCLFVTMGGRLVRCCNFSGGGTLRLEGAGATAILPWVETGLSKSTATSRLSIGTSSCFAMSLVCFAGAGVFDSAVLGTHFCEGDSGSGSVSCTISTYWVATGAGLRSDCLGETSGTDRGLLFSGSIRETRGISLGASFSLLSGFSGTSSTTGVVRRKVRFRV